MSMICCPAVAYPPLACVCFYPFGQSGSNWPKGGRQDSCSFSVSVVFVCRLSLVVCRWAREPVPVAVCRFCA